MGYSLPVAEVVVYGATTHAVERVRDALRPCRIDHAWHTWEDVCTLSLRAVPLVAIVPRITSHEKRGIVRFRQRFPGHPIIVVTDRDVENVSSLASVAIDEFVWLSMIPESLMDAVHRASNGAFFQRLADRISSADHVHDVLRGALCRATLYPVPVRTIGELAELADRHAATLSRHWRATVPARGDFRMEDFLAWMILMRAAQRRDLEGSWRLAAAVVKVDVRTLRRNAARLTGMRLSQIGAMGFAGLATQCEADLRRRLMADDGA